MPHLLSEMLLATCAWCGQIHPEFQGSALVTLGVPLGDVATWLFVFWLCIDWFKVVTSHLGGNMDKLMAATIKTGLDTLAALRGHENDRVPRQATCRV